MLKSFKRSTFLAFDQLKCFGITSQTVLYLIYIARLFTDVTIIHYQILITDPAFTYLTNIRMSAKLSDQFLKSDSMHIVIIFTLLFQLLYFYSILTFDDKKVYLIKKIKQAIIKIVSLTTYVLRIMIVRTTVKSVIFHYHESDYLKMILSLLILTFFFVIIFLNEEFCTQITLIKSSKTLLSKAYHSYNSISEVFIMAAIILSRFSSLNQFAFLSICHGILVLAFSLKLWVLITRKKYYFKEAQNLQIIQCSLCILFYLLIILGKLVDILQENLLLTIIVMTIFSNVAIHNYKNFQNEMSICLLNPSFEKGHPQNITPQFSVSQAQYLIFYIAQMMKQYKRQKQSILLISLVSEHERVCENQSCYHLDYKQKTKSKLLQNLAFRTKFLLSFVQNIYFYYSEQFQIYSLYHIFKLEVALNFPQIQAQLIKYKLNNEKISLAEEFTIFQIQSILLKFIQDKNSTINLIKVQKVISQEQNSRQIIGQIKQTLNLTKTKWQALEASIVNLNQIDQITNSISEKVRNIQNKYLSSISKYQYNIFTQQLFLFYFEFVIHSIAQSKHISKIINLKFAYLKSLKGNSTTNLQKFMYQSKACVIQSHLNPNKMGIISNITENCQKVFGYRKKQLLYQSVNKILPKFLNEQHDKMLHNFMKTGKFTVFGRNLQYFAIKKHTCIKLLVYIQISTSQNQLKIYTLAMKMNSVPNVLLNKSFNIQYYGQKLNKIFDSGSISQLFLSFCINYRQFNENICSKGPQKTQFLLIGNKQIVKQLKRFNISTQNYKKLIRQYNITQSCKNTPHLTVYYCQVQISKNSFGQVQYYALKFNQIKQQFICSENQERQSENIIGNQLNLNVDNNNNQMNDITKKRNSIDIGNVNPVSNAGGLSQSLDNQECSLQGEQERKQQMGQSTASMMSTQGSYYIQKLLKIVKQKFMNKQKIQFRELNIVTLILALLILAIVSFLIIQFVLFSNGLANFQTIVISNQKVSYTLQLLQIIYNKGMLMYQYCVVLPIIPGRCQQVATSAQYTHNYLFDDLSQQFQQLISLKIDVNIPAYSYLMENINFNYGKGSQNILVIDFIQNCYYSIYQIRNQFQTVMTNSTYSNGLFAILKDNWKTIKQINQNCQLKYEQAGFNLLDRIKTQLYVFSGLIMLMSVLIVATQRRFNMYLSQKQQKILRLNQNIPCSYIQEIKNYTDQIIKVVNHHLFKQRDDPQQLPQVQQNAYYRPKSEFTFQTSKKQYIFLIIFLIFIGLAVFYALYLMIQVFQPFKNAQSSINEFINSERSVLQNYFDLKQMFLTGKFNPSNLTQFNQLYDRLFQVQIEYNKVSLKVLNIFPNSQSYHDDIKHFLSGDICKLSASFLSEWQNQQCSKAHFNFYKYGVLALMGYNQRVSVYAALSLKAAPMTAPYLFASDTFYDIDRNPMYLIQIFKLTESRINGEIQSYKTVQIQNCLISASFVLIMLIIVIIFWLVHYKRMKQFYSDIYGHALLFPLPVLKKSKLALKIIQQNLQLNSH